MNVIPAYCELIFNVRAPTVTQLKELVIRVNKCFEAAATATGCKMEIKQQPIYKDVANNSSLAKSYQSFIKDNYGRVVDDITFFASTGESLPLRSSNPFPSLLLLKRARP